MWGITLENLRDLLDESLDGYGYELVHLEMHGREDSKVLRLYIDAPGGVTLDDCSFVSSQIGRLLDVKDPISGKYTLEVSSPGIERPLSKLDHFKRALGERIEVLTHRKCQDRRRFKGNLLRVNESQIELEINSAIYVIDYANIRKANLKPDPNTLNL